MNRKRPDDLIHDNLRIIRIMSRGYTRKMTIRRRKGIIMKRK
jgi:hypothetical protein